MAEGPVTIDVIVREKDFSQSQEVPLPKLNCSNCRFAFFYDGQNRIAPYRGQKLECRRRSPTSGGGLEFFPPLMEVIWCGEHLPKDGGLAGIFADFLEDKGYGRAADELRRLG